MANRCRPLFVTWLGGAILLTSAVGVGALDVVSTTPSHYQLAVDRTISEITVNFDQNLVTPDAEAVRVSGTSSGLHETSVDVTGPVLTITILDGPFHWGEMVNVNLRGDIVSTAPEILIGGFYFAFTIASVSSTADFSQSESFEASDIPYFIYGGDLDNDDVPDVAAPNEGTHDVSVFLNRFGNGVFTTRDEYGVGSKPSSVFGEDFDNDGDQDLVTADIISGTISVLLNNGDGTFAPAVILACGSQTRQVHGGDFDGDNDVDIAATAYGSDHICFFENDGDGTFTLSDTFTDVPDGPFAIRAGDFDADGYLDVAVACNNADVLVVLRNFGGGNFANVGEYFIGNGPWCLNGNDLTGDGYMDLLSVASFGNQFVALINDGTGAFPTTDVSATQSFPLGVFAADLDGDGDIDGTSSNYSAGSVGVYLNDGSGDFTLDAHLPVSNSGSYTWAHDLDGDGDLDLSVVDENADLLFVFYNDGPAASAGDGPLAAEAFRVWPNPLSDGGLATVRLTNFRGEVSVDVLKVDGRRVRRLGSGNLSGSPWEVSWDGRDEAGRRVASGWYLVRVAAPDGTQSAGLQVLR